MRRPEGGSRPLDPRVARYLEERRREGLRVRDVGRLVGDASDRSYFRLFLESETRVLALLPSHFDPESLPFLNVARLFRQIPVRIPRIHHVSPRDGIILLEDLGDDLLQHKAAKVGRDGKRNLYREAIAILVRMQRRGAELESDQYLPYRLAFDETKLLEELRFFERHFLRGYRGAAPTTEEAELLDAAFREIAVELARLPRVLCHRDYHSRNLMVVEEELAVVDFQDARMGPASYDLVSLLRDSYVEHEPDFEADMIEEFCRASGGRQVEAEFDLMALQRNLKALGTFGYQIAVKGNPVYRPYLPWTLGLVRGNLDRNRRWDGLRRALAAHVLEIA